MDNKIFLQGFGSKKSSNTSEGLEIRFKGRKKLLPLNDVAEVLSQYDQYKEERENCNIIRLTCQVNPICSNVLFNRITEIVHSEGSSAVTFINYSINPSGDSKTFENVIFKPKEMDFWCSGDMKYQAVDNTVSRLPSDTKLCDITDVNNYSNGEIEGDGKTHPTNSIRDTQLSKKDVGFIYHCGLDFLNNHLVRSNVFKSVCKRHDDDTNTDYTAFNTIADLMRRVDGSKVVEKMYFPVSETSLEGKGYTKLLALHLYEDDDVLSFKETIEKRLIKKSNGWIGINNKPKLKSYFNFVESTSMEIEKPLSYLNSGDFVDMYPSRDLYSFVPKYNSFQKRIEKNWNYNITYPSSSYTPSSIEEPFSDIFEINEGLNSLKTIYFDENIKGDNGTSQIVMYSISKHGLVVGDYVNVYKTYDTVLYWVSKKNDLTGYYERVTIKYEDEGKAIDEKSALEIENPGEYKIDSTYKKVSVNHKIIDNAKVSEIADEYTFLIFGSDVQISNKWIYPSETDFKNGYVIVDNVSYSIDASKKFLTNNLDKGKKPYYIINDKYVNLDDNAQKISYKKTYGDIECDYYIRIFSKLPNFKFASGDTSSEYEIYKEDENGESMLSKYQENEYNFENHISRLAFAKNIYSDEVGEIVFTDDIDISNIHDNLNRPLTNIYLTFIKNNKGYKEWYGWGGQFPNWSSATTINDEYVNIEYSHCFGPISCGIKTSYESKYDDTVKNISKINYINKCIGGYDVSRINGVRKYYDSRNSSVTIDNGEVWYETDKHFYGDLCCFDNYNLIEKHIQYVNHRFNTAQRENVGDSRYFFQKFTYDEIRRDDYDIGDKYIVKQYTIDECNELKEGYYYNPHYEIPIKTFGKLQTILPDFLTIRQFFKNDYGIYTFVTLEQHFLNIGDKAMLYDTIENKYYKLVTVSYDDNNYRVFTCKVYGEKTKRITDITYYDDERTIENISTQRPLGNITVDKFKLFKMDNLNIPSYAQILKDGTCRIMWRDILNNGFDKNNNSVEEYPFTNGAFYVNKKIDIYLRRQDPYNEYGLYDNTDIEGEITDIIKEDNYIKDTEITC